LAADAQGVFQGVMRFALVQADLGTALHVGIEQPFDDEQRPFDPSDFTSATANSCCRGYAANFRKSWLGGMRPPPWWPRCAGCRASLS
jgi:hypothetical protein